MCGLPHVPKNTKREYTGGGGKFYGLVFGVTWILGYFVAIRGFDKR